MTYAGELGAAVTTFGDSAALLDVKKTDITTGSLDDSGSVGGGVVATQRSVSPDSQLRGQRSAAFARSFLPIRTRSRKNSRVATAVGNSLGRHCCW